MLHLVGHHLAPISVSPCGRAYRVCLRPFREVRLQREHGMNKISDMQHSTRTNRTKLEYTYRKQSELTAKILFILSFATEATVDLQ